MSSDGMLLQFRTSFPPRLVRNENVIFETTVLIPEKSCITVKSGLMVILLFLTAHVGPQAITFN